MLFPWVDIETTGLNPNKDVILEVGIILTDENLNEVNHTEVQIFQAPITLSLMCDEVREMHEKSGLIDRCCGNNSLSLSTSEQYLIYWLQENLDSSDDKPPMCGSSVHFDRTFLKRYMPELESKFHYRNIDVSTVKNLCGAWYPPQFSERPQGEKNHTTISDLRDSIAELKYYRESIFK